MEGAGSAYPPVSTWREQLLVLSILWLAQFSATLFADVIHFLGHPPVTRHGAVTREMACLSGSQAYRNTTSFPLLRGSVHRCTRICVCGLIRVAVFAYATILVFSGIRAWCMGDFVVPKHRVTGRVGQSPSQQWLFPQTEAQPCLCPSFTQSVPCLSHPFILCQSLRQGLVQPRLFSNLLCS